jgi:hypothetical protein
VKVMVLGGEVVDFTEPPETFCFDCGCDPCDCCEECERPKTSKAHLENCPEEIRG